MTATNEQVNKWAKFHEYRDNQLLARKLKMHHGGICSILKGTRGTTSSVLAKIDKFFEEKEKQIEKMKS